MSRASAGAGLARWADRTEARAAPRRPLRRSVREVLVANHMFEALLAAGRIAPPAVPLLNRLAAATTGGTDRVQESHRALATRRLMRFVEMEWLLPADAAVRAVRGLIARHQLKVNMPIELRFVAGDRAFLSPSHGRDSCSVAVHAYRGMAWQPYFRAVERLMWDLEGRPTGASSTFEPSRRCAGATRHGIASRPSGLDSIPRDGSATRTPTGCLASATADVHRVKRLRRFHRAPGAIAASSSLTLRSVRTVPAP